MSKNNYCLLLASATFSAGLFAQQPPMPQVASIDDLMAAARFTAPKVVVPAPVPVPPLGFVPSPLPVGMGLENSLPIAALTSFKKGSFLVATFLSGTGAVAEFQIDGRTTYYSKGDRLIDGWIIRNVATNSVTMDQCKDLSKSKLKTLATSTPKMACISKIVGFEEY